MECKRCLHAADIPCLHAAEGRRCLHAAVSGGDADKLKDLLENLKRDRERAKNLLKEKDRRGDTVLHLAIRRNRLDMVKRLVEFERELQLPSSPTRENETAIYVEARNPENETAIYLAVKLGFLLVVQELVKYSPKSIEIASNKGKNILHLAVELSQEKILKFLVENKKVDLSQLINQPYEPPMDSTQAPKEKKKGRNHGDTPLHIAARNKNIHMVDRLLKVPGVNKDAVNKAGLTPLDIARENTEYDESYKIIEKLSVYPPWDKPFLYSAPTMSLSKQKKGMKILDTFFVDRRNVELVVATLLATMTFAAVFAVPGGFSSADAPDGGGSHGAPVGSPYGTPQGAKGERAGFPVLIGNLSFKVFLIFDCLAFFLSIFTVLMWEMSSPLTARDKILFIYLTNGAVCIAFAFTAFSLTAAVYTMLTRKVKKIAVAIVLDWCIFLISIGVGVFVYMAAKFLVRIARFHRLCGVPCVLDDSVEKCWVMAENLGLLDVFRTWDYFWHRCIWGDLSREKRLGESTRGNKSSSTLLDRNIDEGILV